MNIDFIEQTIDESVDVILQCKKDAKIIQSIANEIILCFENNNKVVLFGNGGSAADAQHIAAEFIGRFQHERKSLPAISLTTDTSIITALGNDYTFDIIFSRQCESLINKNDIVIAISTSGSSKNILLGANKSKELGAKTILFTSSKFTNAENSFDYVVSVSSSNTARIQEAHRVLLHIICNIVDEHFAS